MRTWIVSLIVAIMATLPLAAAEVPSSISVVTAFIDAALDTALASLPAQSSINFVVSDHPDKDWIESLALSKLSDRGLTTLDANTAASIRLVIDDLSTRYQALGSADSVQRVITSNMTFVITVDGTRRVVSYRPQADTLACLRRDAIAAESDQHHSTRGEMPAEERTLWDEVLEPAIFVVAAVATVVLLFTVRSQ